MLKITPPLYRNGIAACCYACSLPLHPRDAPAEHVARARVLVLPPRAGHVHCGAFFRGDDEGVGEGEDWGSGVSEGYGERGQEGRRTYEAGEGGEEGFGCCWHCVWFCFGTWGVLECEV